MQDDRYQENQLSFALPTDNGLLSFRSAQQQGPPHPLRLENQKMNQRLVVSTDFLGTWPKDLRQARFVEDYADTNPTTLRNTDGTVQYYASGGDGPCQIPGNMINNIVLQFKIKPRSTL
jgi:hypothetical protein